MEKAMASQTFTIYNILRNKKEFTDEEAQTIASALEAKENIATKTDLLALELKLTEKFSRMEKCNFVFFVIIMAAIVLTNPKALEIISKFLGMAK